MEYIKKVDLLNKAVEVEYLNRPRLMVSVATIGQMPSIDIPQDEEVMIPKSYHDKVCEEIIRFKDKQFYDAVHLLDDGTLEIHVTDYKMVKRVLVEDDNNFGNLFYEDSPDIVFCKDCRHFSVVSDEEEGTNYYRCGVWSNATDEDAFCSYGAKMKGADDE